MIYHESSRITMSHIEEPWFMMRHFDSVYCMLLKIIWPLKKVRQSALVSDIFSIDFLSLREMMRHRTEKINQWEARRVSRKNNNEFEIKLNSWIWLATILSDDSIVSILFLMHEFSFSIILFAAANCSFYELEFFPTESFQLHVSPTN